MAFVNINCATAPSATFTGRRHWSYHQAGSLNGAVENLSPSTWVRPPNPRRLRCVTSCSMTPSLSASADNTVIMPPSTSPPTPTSLSSMSTPLELPTVSRSVVWFRVGDLRVDDHPGVDAARAFTRETVSYIVTCTTPTTTSTIDAIVRMRSELYVRSEHLHVWVSSENDRDEVNAIVQFIRERQAERVHVCSDVDTAGVQTIEVLQSLLFAGEGENPVAINTWIPQTLHTWTEFSSHSDIITQVPDIFPKFVKWRKKVTSKTPISEPLVPFMINPSHETSPSNNNSYNADQGHDQVQQTTSSVKNNTSGNANSNEQPEFATLKSNDVLEWREQFRERYDQDMELAGGLPPVGISEPSFGERALLAYLQRGEQDTANNGAPDFGRSLGEVLRQGALSHPRMRAIVEEHERANGRIFYWVYSDAAKLVLQALEALEFSTVLARRDVALDATVDGTHSARFWRWNGFLIRYIDEGPIDRSVTPILLIHGFGASSFHFQKSVAALKGYRRVVALDVLGFGRSDKPPMRYTNPVWEALIWDFVREIIQQPVYVAGNSIGGIFASSFGTDAYPSLCSGICLINTAGPLVDASPMPSTSPSAIASSSSIPAEPQNTTPSQAPIKAPQKNNSTAQYIFSRWRWTRILAGRFFLRSLRGRVRKTLNAFYPTNPIPENDKLVSEIMRASYDYGAVDVLASGIIAPKQRSYETLLRKYNGPLLVFNGILDPLGNVRMRTDSFKKIYPNATVVAVEAGHCPHDEVPGLFIEALTSWIDNHEQNSSSSAMREGESRESHQSAGLSAL